MYFCHDNLKYQFLLISFINMGIIYNQKVIKFQKERLSLLTESEASLKSSMYRKNINYKVKEEKNRLNYENMLLQERNELSQKLHDKVGHNINGSIYQLEAARLLIGKDNEKALTR